MSVNIENLSLKELDALIVKATQRKEKIESRPSPAEVRRMLAALAKENGYTLEDFFGEAPRSASNAKGGKVAPKYRHPATGETWSGRGKPPKWLAAEIAKGKKATDFAI